MLAAMNRGSPVVRTVRRATSWLASQPTRQSSARPSSGWPTAGNELLGGPAHGEDDQESGCGGHDCTCGEVDEPGHPELDTRVIPHAIRHATIFGALDGVRPGAGMVVVTSHDPLPLIAQLDQRAPGVFGMDYLERGPEVWRLLFVRRSDV